MAVNERQDEWNIYLPHVEFNYNSAVSAATGLARNQVHINRRLRFPLTIFVDACGHQGLGRDQLEYCNLAVDRQPRRSYDLGRQQMAINASGVGRPNPALTTALHKNAVLRTNNCVNCTARCQNRRRRCGRYRCTCPER